MSDDNIDQALQEERFNNHKCPKCGLGMLLLRSMNKKTCIDCHIDYAWSLKPGELPLILHQRE